MSSTAVSPRTLSLFLGILLVIAVLGGVAAVITVRSNDSGGSTTPTAGMIVSSTPITNAPAGSVGWRIVYTTTTASGEPAQSSGTVYVPTSAAPSEGRFVVAWAHPTLGLGQDCTPSQASDPSTAIPGFAQMIANGWAIASTDYTGLGTEGTLPYLISLGEAHNVIDSVRAARNLPGTDAGSTYAVWGHSQGGHASLSTGEEATSYAPELRLVGVAAAAPAAELPALVQLQWQQPESWIIGSEVITLWPQFYPQLQPNQITTPLGLENASAVGAACITSNPAALIQQFGALLLQPFFSVNPMTVPAWSNELIANTPQPLTNVPVYVAQGLEDTTVPSSTTALLDQQWCQQNSELTVQWFPTATHFSVPAMAAPSAMTWLSQVFSGQSPGSTCGQATPVAPAANPTAS
jgi:pimeloyl-ACP methyl ester carboxylesterase